MLVLSRRVNETIVFPELGITIEVLNSYGAKTRIGIAAPDSVRILRGELLSGDDGADDRRTHTQRLNDEGHGLFHSHSVAISSLEPGDDPVTIDPGVLLTSIARLG